MVALLALGFVAWADFEDLQVREAELDLSLWSAVETFLAVLIYGGAASLVVFIGKVVQIIVTTPAPNKRTKTTAEGREDRFCGPGAFFEYRGGPCRCLMCENKKIMSETRQTEEMTRAAREFTGAARDLTAAMDRLSGLLQRREHGYVPGEALRDVIGSGGLPEEEARELATRLVRRARKEGGVRESEAPPPSPEEVRARREARRRREAS